MWIQVSTLMGGSSVNTTPSCIATTGVPQQKFPVGSHSTASGTRFLTILINNALDPRSCWERDCGPGRWEGVTATDAAIARLPVEKVRRKLQ